MKSLTRYVLFVGTFVLIGFGVRAQESKSSKIAMTKVLADTTLVRAVEVTLRPGQKTETHSHPAYFFRMITDGKLLVLYTDGSKENFDLKAGDSGFSGPERPHVTENVGKKTLKFLVVELKEHPYMESK